MDHAVNIEACTAVERERCGCVGGLDKTDLYSGHIPSLQVDRKLLSAADRSRTGPPSLHHLFGPARLQEERPAKKNGGEAWEQGHLADNAIYSKDTAIMFITSYQIS